MISFGDVIFNCDIVKQVRAFVKEVVVNHELWPLKPT